jgi:hypothetical protein
VEGNNPDKGPGQRDSVVAMYEGDVSYGGKGKHNDKINDRVSKRVSV